MVVSVLILLILSIFAENISKLTDVIKGTNFYNQYYKLKDPLVLLGSLNSRDLFRFIVTLIDRKGL